VPRLHPSLLLTASGISRVPPLQRRHTSGDRIGARLHLTQPVAAGLDEALMSNRKDAADSPSIS